MAAFWRVHCSWKAEISNGNESWHNTPPPALLPALAGSVGYRAATGRAGTNSVSVLHPTNHCGGNDQVNGVAVDIWGNIYATGFGRRHRDNLGRRQRAQRYRATTVREWTAAAIQRRER